MIYLDNAATTKVSPEVMEAMLPYFSDTYGNPGSIHSAGRTAEKAIEDARIQVAEPIGADPSKIIFTGGGSEANTLAIMGLMAHLKAFEKNHIITTRVEHHSVLGALNHLSNHGFYITYIPTNELGEIDYEMLEASICDRTGLVSIMTVNNETGNRYDVYRIGQICRKNYVFFHTDCVQAYCGTTIDVNECCIDLLSASGHKIHAPKGVGFLYARCKGLLSPVVFGGSQEWNLRGGTHNVPYVVGMGQAAEIAYAEHLRNPHSYGEMIESLKHRILYRVPSTHVNGMPHGNSKTINFRFDGVDGETLLLLLDSKGIQVSAGSACSAHYAKPSHVLSAIGLTDDEARSSIRISVSKYTTHEEIDDAAQVIADSVKQLRGG